ncbi:hypothetical protein CTI12_AA038120 [Artemisia annua]|uniref:Uncharacterized protein n=1 Tax=Artemisia annua TaxID=35608 RepID=A0A2U1QFP4_ARTAN|nr:hypothetical protein CTI12_AA038120 [Artemisia annua]
MVCKEGCIWFAAKKGVANVMTDAAETAAVAANAAAELARLATMFKTHGNNNLNRSRYQNLLFLSRTTPAEKDYVRKYAEVDYMEDSYDKKCNNRDCLWSKTFKLMCIWMLTSQTLNLLLLFLVPSFLGVVCCTEAFTG